MPLRVAIIGGGIGGLTLAVALSRIQPSIDLINAVQIDIYEASSELTQIGAGITLWPRAWNILEQLGLKPSLLDHLAPGQQVPNRDDEPRLAFQFRKSDQENGASIHDLIISGAALSFHRAVVQEILLNHLSASIRCHLSSRLTSYDEIPESTSIRLVFEDGKTTTCDLLIGVDGIKSIVRKKFVADHHSTEFGPVPNADPMWSGTFAYRGMVESKVVAEKMPNHRVLTTPVVYCGKNKHVVAYPILQGRVVNVVGYLSDLRKEGAVYDGPSFVDVSKDDVIPIFDKWEEEVRVLIEHMDKPSRWAIHAIEPLTSYASGSVVLLGDAAHAMTPHQGNGTGQAIEDAYILAHLLSKAIRDGIPISAVTKVYDDIRQPFGNFVQSASRSHGLLYEFNAPGFEDVQELDNSLSSDRLAKLGQLITSEWEYAWLTSAEGDCQKALAMLETYNSLMLNASRDLDL
ncbi:FAD/NAD(P)-binding domain-containing protein [Phlegmacium glaucopus]|nr:FAD/NAD(P)-binding domain-containing protein [Phlegmacium glaucopus]